MPVRIFCQCGKEVTHEVSEWDQKTRTLFWMNQHAPACAACRQRHMVASGKPAWAPNARNAVAGRKAAAR